MQPTRRHYSTLLTAAALTLPLPAASTAATVSWSSTTSGQWLTPSNWSPAATPTSVDSVFITKAGTYTVTLGASTTVGPITLNNPNATLTVAGSNNAVFNTADVLLSTGHLVLGQSGTGTANLIASNGAGTVTNQGTIDIYAPAGPFGSTGAINATLVNSGTINATGGAPTFARPVTNTGSLVAPAGTKFLVTGSTFNQNAGSLSGTLTFSGTTFNYNGGSLDFVYFNRLTSATTLNFGPNASSGTFATVGLTLSVGTLPAGNTLYVNPNTSVNYTGTANNGHLALNRPNPGLTSVFTASATLNFPNGIPSPFTNNGTLDLDNPLSLHANFNAPLVNNGSVNMAAAYNASDYNPSYFSTPITNNGNVTIDPNAFVRVHNYGATFTQNAGTLTTNNSLRISDTAEFVFNGGSVTGGTVLLDNTRLTLSPAATGPGDFTFNSGSISGDIPAATTITLKPLTGNPTAQTLLGKSDTNVISNAGTLRSDASGSTLRPTLSLSSSGTLINTGTITGINNRFTTKQGANLFISGSLTNSGTITAYGLTVSNTFTQDAGTLNVTNLCSVSNNGTFNFNGGTLTGNPVTLNYNNTLNISAAAGPANFSFTGSASTLHAPNLAPGSVLNLAPPTLTPATPLTVTADPLTNAGTITLKYASTLTITGPLSNPGTIDLQGPHATLLLDPSTPLDSVRAQLLTSHLTSSTADAQHRLAYIISPSNIRIQLTPTGDANADGKLDGDDYALLDRGFAQHAATWSSGDFNYDGTVDQNDYLLLDTAYGQSKGLSPAFLSQRESQFGPAYVSSLLASVPETTTGLLLPTLLPLARRRRTP